MSDKARRQIFLNDALDLIAVDEIYNKQFIVFLLIDLFYEIQDGNKKIILKKKQMLNDTVHKYDDSDDLFLSDIKSILQGL